MFTASTLGDVTHCTLKCQPVRKNVYAIPEKPEKHVAEAELCADNGAETLPQSVMQEGTSHSSQLHTRCPREAEVSEEL